MSNLSMIFNNKSDAASLSGGSWVAALPLANMQNTLLKKTARSTSASLANTQFVVDLGASGIFYKTIALLSHNLETSAKIRVRCSDDAAFATSEFDTGWIDAYQYSTPTTETMWEEPNWWDGKPAAYDLAGYSLNSIVLADYLIDARYIKVEFDDISNAAGYIELGRLMIAPITELLVNMDYGAAVAWEDSSTISESIGGVDFATIRKKKRLFSCGASYLKDAEALATVFEMQKFLGVTGEVFVMPDREDTVHGFRNSFLARMTQLSGIEKYMYGQNKTSYSFREKL